MDKVDLKIIDLLQKNARYSLKTLAEEVFLSTPEPNPSSTSSPRHRRGRHFPRAAAVAPPVRLRLPSGATAAAHSHPDIAFYDPGPFTPRGGRYWPRHGGRAWKRFDRRGTLVPPRARRRRDAGAAAAHRALDRRLSLQR